MTNPHISEELPRLLTGEATHDVVLAAAEHLRSCPDCQQELVSAVVAHAALTSAHRFAPEIVTRRTDTSDESETLLSDAPEPDQLPNLSAMFDQVRNEAATQAHPAHRQRRRLLSVAAAAVILAGGGIAIAESVGSSSSSSSQHVALSAFNGLKYNASGPKATVKIGSASMHIDASALPKLDSQHFYEVWLTNSARNKMQSVGIIGDDNKATLPVKPKVMSQYSDIEVSVQRNSDTAYSLVSVLRGSY